MTTAATLIVPLRAGSTGELLAEAAARRGMVVERAGAEAAVTAYPAGVAHLYGGPRFAARTASGRGIAPLEPADAWLTTLPAEFRRRDVELMSMGDARWLRDPVFVK